MTFQTVAIPATLAVKNGPPGMWRSLGAPSTGDPIGRLVTSPLWLVATTCIFLALAAVVSRRVRRGVAAPGRALVPTTAILGLLVVAEWLTRSAIVSLLALTLMAAAWIGVLHGAEGQRARTDARTDARRVDARSDAEHTDEPCPAEVVDLAHWRESKRARRRAGSR